MLGGTNLSGKEVADEQDIGNRCWRRRFGRGAQDGPSAIGERRHLQPYQSCEPHKVEMRCHCRFC